MHALSINNVSKSYGRVEVLKNIDINIEAGEFLILVGPSGCGKSTLLSLIAGLDEVTSGSIHIGERDVTNLTPKDRDIAMVFQSYALYPNKTVRGNIEFGLKIRGMAKQDINQTIDRVAALLQIEDLLDRKPSQLSGGQRQRVAMGRAISRNPSLYLFDEPLSNLDAKLRVEMRAEIKLLHQRVKTSTVYVTHDQVEAMTLGDRIAVMKGGIIQQFGTPEEVYTRPNNMFVASFMGSPAMNFIPVTIDGEGKSFTLKTKVEEKVFPIMGEHPEIFAYKGKEVILGLRPEDFTNADEQSAHTIKVPLELNEFTGADLMAYSYFNDSRVICRCDPSQSKGLDSLELGLRLTNSLFYDQSTEELIE